MSKYFKINGYWKDNNEPFEGYVVKEFDSIEFEEDEDIFEFGWSEDRLQKELNQKDTIKDWVLTGYEKEEIMFSLYVFPKLGILESNNEKAFEIMKKNGYKTIDQSYDDEFHYWTIMDRESINNFLNK